MAGVSQGAAPNVDPFDAYFRRADLDRDGRVSGAEAVAFFQGSGLPKNVLAQIWNYADQNRTGYLGRAEFYNALRLVTVAQSKRELTPDIVKAALYTPASAKIPAPQINLSAISGHQPNAVGTPGPQGGPAGLLSQNPTLRAASPPNATVGQHHNNPMANQSVRPPQPMPGGLRPMPSVTSQGFSGPGSSFGSVPPATQLNIDVRTSGAPTLVGSQVTNRGINLPSMQAGPGSGLVGPAGPLQPKQPASIGIVPSGSANSQPRAPVSQNGFASFGVDAFSAASSHDKKDSSLTASSSSIPVSSELVPVSGGDRSSASQGSLGNLHNSHTAQQVGEQPQRVQSIPKQNQQVTVPRPGLPPSVPVPGQPHPHWPRMTQSDVHKYTKVFVEVDTDKDGKITGLQARNLFLSWRLPRDVLKQVWDLSDQDNDSMLSLREFCIALYLMERYREGRPLPSVLPNNIMYDIPPAAPPAGGHAAWGYAPGSQQAMPGTGARHIPRPAGKPPLPIPAPHADEKSNSKQQRPKVPVLEKHLVDQLSEEEQKNLNSKFEEATEANKKVEELEKDIKESREKMEFVRSKMQELVLYKSRCENRLNEITARVAADKREVELLAKRYEEKYKESGDVASKLTLEESTFRDIQERKMELYRAIVKLEQDGGNDESKKSRAEQIQSNLEELVKSVNDRCKNYGLRGKPTTILELPFGWQPGIQEGAADWDEDWDKFDDEGFTSVKELTLDVQNVIAPPKTKSRPAKKEKNPNNESEEAAPVSDAEAQKGKVEGVFKEATDAEAKTEKLNGVVERVTENGSAHEDHEAVTAKSPMGSPLAKSSDERDEKVFSDSSPQAQAAKSENGGFDDQAWGSFDNNDDIDSVWGFNAVSTSKGNDDLFGPGGFALNPIKTGSSFGDNNSLMKGSTVFDNSVPSTPLFPPSYSPEKANEGPDDLHASAFSRFDSFRSTESGFQPGGTFSRFDSMKSTKDFDYGTGFPSFDDADPFGSGPFRSSLGTETPRSEVDPYGSRSSRLSLGSETPRSEVDPFGAGAFRSSFGGETPRRDSDPFGQNSFQSSFSETPRRDLDSFGVGQFKSSFASETPRSEYDGFGSVGPFKSSFESETPRSEWMGGETPRGGDFDSSFRYSGPFRPSTVGNETPRSELDPFGSSSGPFRSSFGDETPRSDADPFGASGPFKSSFTSETPKGGTNSWNAF